MPRTRDKFVIGLGLLCVCLVAGILWHSNAPPLFGDYAEWTYHGVLLRDVLQGHPDGAYWLKNYPVPNDLTTAGLGLLMCFLPWKVAAKVWILVQVASGLICAYELQRAAGKPEVWRTLVLAAAAILGAGVWFGFENFFFGVYFAMFFCSLLLRDLQSRWLYAALLVLIFFSHMIPLGFALLLLLLFAQQQGRWALLWQAIPSVMLCAWYFAGRVLHGDADAKAGMVASVAWMTPAFAAFKVNSYLKSWGFINPALTGDDSILLRLAGIKVFLALFLLNAIVAAAMLVLLGTAAWRAWKVQSETRFFWIAAAMFVAMGLVMPGAAAGISDPGARMMQVTLWSGVCLVGLRRRWAAAVLAVCASALLTANLVLMQTVAMKPPMAGENGGPLPARLRQFAHVFYANRAGDYDSLEAGKMTLDIFPTAMFLKKDAAR